MTQRAILVAFIAVGVLSTHALVGQQAKLTKKELGEAFVSRDSHLRHNTWKRLNPEDSSHYGLIIKILKTLNWYDRSAAIEALTRANSDKVLKKMARSAIKHRYPFVRQGLVHALAEMNDPRYYPTLYEALNDKHPYVRRMAVYALGLRNKEANVDALVKLFQKEKNPVVRTFIEASLNEITQAHQGPEPVRWNLWWTQAKADPDFELGKTDEESLRKAEKFGRKLEENVTRVAGVDLATSSKGSGSPILILPTYGYSKNTMLPFLSELERHHKLFYMDLPPIKSFKNLQSVSEKKIVYYPIDQLVEAFEGLRKKTGETHFAIMACGMNSWIAMRYAKMYPKSLAGMILVAPLSGQAEYARATDRLQNTGKQKKDTEMFYFGLGRRFNSETGEGELEKYHREKKIPKTPGEDAAVTRRGYSLLFKEERDGMLAMLFGRAFDRGASTVAIPPFELRKQVPPSFRVPTLVISGKRDLITSVGDGKLIADFYRGKHFVFEHSACMPFAEESPRFNQLVGNFLKKYARPKAKDKRARAAKDEEKAKATKKRKTKKTRSSKSDDSKKKKKKKRKRRPKKGEERPDKKEKKEDR